MEDAALKLLTLARTPGLGNRRIASLVRAGGVDQLLQNPAAFADVLSPATLESLLVGSARRNAELIQRRSVERGQRLVALGEAEYPVALAAIYDPPPVLFVRGTLLPALPRVAVVGARGATGSGRSLARDIARGLAREGIEVVSGLARGVDGSAHEGALSQAFGRTIAVLGSSLDIVYPAEHRSLAARVEGSGATISEFPPGTPPAPAQFPLRNRIIVGFSEAVVVIEAGAKSGALITARVALEEGRDVLAVPGRPGDPLACGTNQLIRDGATLVRGVDDVLDHLGLRRDTCQAPAERKDDVLRVLSTAPSLSFDQLIVNTGLDVASLLQRLSELELQGRVERLPGSLFRGATPA